MEKYVTSREWSEKLRDAGYLQPTQFIWRGNRIEGGHYLDKAHHTQSDLDLPAPLSDELLEQFPTFIDTHKEYELSHLKIYVTTERQYLAYYSTSDPKIHLHKALADKPADALAALWIYCRENGYIIT